MYAKYFKRILDIFCALLAISCFCWLYIILAILVKVKLGSPVLFTQPRPGKKDENGVEQIFKLYKFRTMTDEKDEQGKLLPDKVRLTKFGRWLRSTSLDELPEAFNILRGKGSYNNQDGFMEKNTLASYVHTHVAAMPNFGGNLAISAREVGG